MPTQMRISRTGLEFIKSFESYVPYLYDDMHPPRGGKYPEWRGEKLRGTLTIGYGHTRDAKAEVNMEIGARISEPEAAAILDIDLDEVEQAVNAALQVAVTQGQFDALVSFAFNCGMGNARKIIARLNRGDEAGARAAFDLYVKSKGVVLRGLQRRRDGEQALWDRLVSTPLLSGVVLPDAGEIVHHPANVDEPARRKTMLASKEGWSAAIGGAAAAVPVVKAGAELAQDATDTARQVAGLLNDPLVLGAAAALACAALAYLFFKRWERSHVELVP